MSELSLDGFSSGNAGVTLRSQDGTFNISFTSPPFEDGQTLFDISGTLFPNVYSLTANANMNSSVFGVGVEGGISDYDLDFKVVATPAPAAVWLFGSGLIGLIGLARRKKPA